MQCTVKLQGCDDRTVFAMDVTEDGFEFLRLVAEESRKASTYDCQPTMEVIEGVELLNELNGWGEI